MATETTYFINRLTAPKPNWELAVLYAKGVEPVPIGSGYAKVRIAGDYLIVDISKVQYPDPEGKRRAIADLQIQFHMDEVVRVDFYDNVQAAPVTKVPAIIAPSESAVNNASKLVRP